MLEINFITQIWIAIILVGLAIWWFIYHRQRQRIALQKAELRRQKFALKKARIIQEISHRQGTGNPNVILSGPLQRSERPAMRTINAKGQEILSNAPALNERRADDRNQLPRPENEHGQLIQAPLAKAAAGNPAPARKSTPRKQQQSRQPARPEIPAGPVIMMQKTAHPRPLGEAQRGGKQIAGPFRLNSEDGLYEQIRSFSAWLAGQSGQFIIDRLRAGSLEDRVYLLITPDELERRNGHWFDLFRPPSLDEITSTISNGTALSCPFDHGEIDQIITPARQIIDMAKKEGSSRYRQVLKESALEDFVNFMEDLKLQIATDDG